MNKPTKQKSAELIGFNLHFVHLIRQNNTSGATYIYPSGTRKDSEDTIGPNKSQNDTSY